MIKTAFIFTKHILATVLAMALISTLSSCSRKSPETYINEAEALLKSEAPNPNAIEEALALINRAIERGADSPRVRMFQAMCLIRSGDVDQGIKVAADAAERSPEDFQNQFFYGQFLIEKKRYEAALPYLRKAYEQNPDHEGLLALLVRCCLKQTLKDEGLKYINELRGMGYQAFVLDNAAATLYLKRAEYQEALIYYKRALENYKKEGHQHPNVTLLQNIAVTYDIHLHNRKKAKQYYRRCIAAAQKIGDQRRNKEILNRLVQITLN